MRYWLYLRIGGCAEMKDFGTLAEAMLTAREFQEHNLSRDIGSLEWKIIEGIDIGGFVRGR